MQLLCMRRCWKSWQRTLGDEHPDTLTSMYNLAEAYWRLGRREDSMELFEKEWKACLRVHGEEHRQTLMSLQNLIVCYLELGLMENAINLAPSPD